MAPCFRCTTPASQSRLEKVVGALRDYLDYDKGMGGSAASIWPQVLGMGMRDLLFGKPILAQLSIICELAISNMESKASQLRSMIEYSAGYGNLSRAFRRKFKVASFDKEYSSNHNVLTSEGLQLWLLCLCCCGAGSFLWFAPECSSFVCLSVSKSCRNEANNFMGDTSREFVRTGNSLMILHSMLMAIALALGHHVGLEQPSSSSMMSTTWISSVIKFFNLRQTHTYLGAFGGVTCKPLILTSSLDLQGMRRDKPSMSESLTTRNENNGFTGKKGMLVESQMYTVGFSEALAKIVQAQL